MHSNTRSHAGKEWNTAQSHAAMTKPRITTKAGAVIEPLALSKVRPACDGLIPLILSAQSILAAHEKKKEAVAKKRKGDGQNGAGKRSKAE